MLTNRKRNCFWISNIKFKTQDSADHYDNRTIAPSGFSVCKDWKRPTSFFESFSKYVRICFNAAECLPSCTAPSQQFFPILFTTLFYPLPSRAPTLKISTFNFQNQQLKWTAQIRKLTHLSTDSTARTCNWKFYFIQDVSCCFWTSVRWHLALTSHPACSHDGFEFGRYSRTKFSKRSFQTADLRLTNRSDEIKHFLGRNPVLQFITFKWQFLHLIVQCWTTGGEWRSPKGSGTFYIFFYVSWLYRVLRGL